MSESKINLIAPIEQSFTLISALSLIQQNLEISNKAKELAEDGTLDKSDVKILRKEFRKITDIAKQQQSVFEVFAKCHTKLQTLAENSFPKGTKISFDENGKLATAILGAKHPIQGISFPKNTELHFYKNGKLSSAKLVADQVIQGFHCAKDSWVRFKKDGSLSSITLAAKHTVEKLSFPKGTELRFHDDGYNLVAKLAVEQTVHLFPFPKGKKFPKGTEIKFSKAGELLEVKLAVGQIIKGFSFPKDTELTFFSPSGKVSIATLGADHELENIHFRKGTIIYFYDTHVLLEMGKKDGEDRYQPVYNDGRYGVYGKLMAAELSDETTVQGIRFSKGTVVHFEKDKLSLATLGSAQMVQGIPFFKGASIIFHNDGKIAYINPPRSGLNIVKGFYFPEGTMVYLRKDGTLKEAKKDGEITHRFDKDGKLIP